MAKAVKKKAKKKATKKKTVKKVEKVKEPARPLTAVEKMASYMDDILLFVSEEFGVTPDRWQEKALLGFANKDKKIFRMSMQACAGPGKSALLAWCGWWFMCTKGERGNHPKGAVVSVTADNLKDNLWAEFSKWQEISPMLMGMFKWTKTRIYAYEHPNTWFLSARSFNKSANAEEQGRTLSGVHSKYVLYLIDESGDIPEQVLKACEQGLSTADKEFGRVIQAGNPTSQDGMLYAAQGRLSSKWNVIRITGDPDDPDRSPRIDIDWAAEQIKQYGRDDPWVSAYILGRFPKTSISSLLSRDEVEKAMARTCFPEDYDQSQKRLGIDVARFGMDSTIIAPRQGLRSFKMVELKKTRSNIVAARVAKAKVDWGSEMEFVDGTGGHGSGVVDSLFQAGFNPHEVHFSGKADEDKKYFNKRAEMWFRMAEWVKRGGILPYDEKLLKELTAPTYSFKGGRFILESKEQLKKRLGFSPDKADALALTFTMAEMPASHTGYGLANKAKMKHEYNPLD